MLVQRTAPVPGLVAVGFDFRRTCRAQLRALIAGYCGKFKVSCTLSLTTMASALGWMYCGSKIVRLI